MRRTVRALTAAVALCLGANAATADEVIFLNGDRLTGKITSAAKGRLTIRTEAAGNVTIDLERVRTFSTDAPVTLRVGDATFTSTVTTGPNGAVQAATAPGDPPRPIPLAALTHINPPPTEWRGSLAATGLFTTGNAETATVGLKLDAARRGETDRVTIGAGYLWGRQRDPDTGDSETTIDNAFGFGKYDHFFTKRLYGLASVRIERDRIADLDLRLTPSVGLGYQWFEGPRFNLATEAGVAWVYEDYRNAPSEERLAARLAYRVDYRPHEAVLLFHDLEWLPAYEDPLDDYNVNADAGLRATIMGGLFSELKVEWRYDSTPAPDARNTDIRYLLSLGWSF